MIMNQHLTAKPENLVKHTAKMLKLKVRTITSLQHLGIAHKHIHGS